MSKFMKPLSVAVGVAFVGSLAITQAASASSFSLSDMDSGYQLAGDPAKEADKAKEGTCGEGKCGADKAKEAHCGAAKGEHEGKCGEGKCGEGKCGADKAKEGADKAKEEGKCGEGKCGGEKDKKEGSCGGSR